VIRHKIAVIRAYGWLLIAAATFDAALAQSPMEFPSSGESRGIAALSRLDGPPVSVVNLDEQMAVYEDDPSTWEPYYGEPDGFWLLPQGLIYRSYLAGPKESRIAATIERIQQDTSIMDGIVGTRVALFRIGSKDPVRPRGFEMDVEGAAMVRLDLEEEVDVRSTDFRVGVPFTWGNERHQWKFAYYHISSHLGDEFLIKNEGFPLFFQVRDALVLGYSYYLTDSVRLYGEAGWAFKSHASEPWEFQFGLDCAPRIRTGLRGAPFFAINGLLRQEVDFGGGLNVQTGWAWRSDVNAHLLRFGLQYYNGNSMQFAFLPFHEEQFGIGLWYDF